MNASRGIFATCAFALLRFSPIAVAYLILDLSTVDAPGQIHLFDRTLRLFAVLALWSLVEGLSMLWIKKKNTASSDARGYAAVTLLAAFLVLGMLQLFRAQASQSHFLLLLTALALRGMSRGGWEQGRPHVSLLTAIAAQSLLAALSMMLALNSLPWPTYVIALAVGSLLGAVEASWYGTAFKGQNRWWIEPVHRLSLVFPPLAITALAVLHVLPPLYALCFALTPVAARTAKRASIRSLETSSELYTIAGTYLVFMAIMAVCRIYL
jgi:hypothetical protein